MKFSCYVQDLRLVRKHIESEVRRVFPPPAKVEIIQLDEDENDGKLRMTP